MPAGVHGSLTKSVGCVAVPSTVYPRAEYLAGMGGLPSASTIPEGTRLPRPPSACNLERNVAEFPGGIGHNSGFRSVTPAQRLRIHLRRGMGHTDGY